MTIGKGTSMAPPKTPDETASEVIKLQEIIDALPTHNGEGPERRQYSLTKGDVILIYKIARVAAVPHVCPFEGEDAAVLQGVAKSVTRTQKIAGVAIITALIGGILSGAWYAAMALVREFVQNGGVLPK